MFFIGLGIILGFYWLFIGCIGGSVHTYIDLLSWVTIIIPLLAVLTATRSFKLFVSGLKAAVFPKEAITDELRGQAVSLFRLLSKTAALAMVLSLIICLINLGIGIDFSRVDAASLFAMNTAASLVPLVFALLLIIAVFEPIVFILKSKKQ